MLILVTMQDELLEEERERDQAEKAEFEKRLRDKDDAKTRKVGASADEGLTFKKQGEKSDNMKTNDEIEQELLPDLRVVSRQKYLEKREDKKMKEIEDEILDEEFLFQGVTVTEKERKDLEYKKKVFELAKQRVRVVEDKDR